MMKQYKDTLDYQYRER